MKKLILVLLVLLSCVVVAQDVGAAGSGGHDRGWEYLTAGSGDIDLPGNADDPTIDSTTGFLIFTKDTTDAITYTFVLPSTYVEGTSIYPHVLWRPVAADTGNVYWQLEYEWVNLEGTFAGSWDTTYVLATSDSVADKMSEEEMTSITGTGKEIMSALNIRLTRVGNDASDDLDKDAELVALAIIYSADTRGSRYGTSKE